VKYWDIIADNLKKAGWSWGDVSAVDSNGRTIWIVDAHRGWGVLSIPTSYYGSDGAKFSDRRSITL
jgi:hypothetical protein